MHFNNNMLKYLEKEIFMTQAHTGCFSSFVRFVCFGRKGESMDTKRMRGWFGGFLWHMMLYKSKVRRDHGFHCYHLWRMTNEQMHPIILLQMRQAQRCTHGAQARTHHRNTNPNACQLKTKTQKRILCSAICLLSFLTIIILNLDGATGPERWNSKWRSQSEEEKQNNISIIIYNSKNAQNKPHFLVNQTTQFYHSNA